jgi:hypothetical protein
MNSQESIDLKKLIKGFQDEFQDNTEYIRKVKHSEFIKNDIDKLIQLKREKSHIFKTSPNKFIELAQNEAFFLFKNYTDIFNKIRKNEIDLKILFNFLDVLNKIESGELDQHEGSFVVGKLLKEMYIDSALKKADKLNKDRDDEKERNALPVEEPKKISFKEFKQLKLTR